MASSCRSCGRVPRTDDDARAVQRKYLPALAELTRTVAQPERLSRHVDELAAVIGPVPAEEPADARTPAFKESLGEAPFKRPINLNVTVVPIKTFVRLRHASVVAQLHPRACNRVSDASAAWLTTRA